MSGEEIDENKVTMWLSRKRGNKRVRFRVKYNGFWEEVGHFHDVESAKMFQKVLVNTVRMCVNGEGALIELQLGEEDLK